MAALILLYVYSSTVLYPSSLVISMFVTVTILLHVSAHISVYYVTSSSSRSKQDSQCNSHNPFKSLHTLWVAIILPVLILDHDTIAIWTSLMDAIHMPELFGRWDWYDSVEIFNRGKFRIQSPTNQPMACEPAPRRNKRTMHQWTHVCAVQGRHDVVDAVSARLNGN